MQYDPDHAAKGLPPIPDTSGNPHALNKGLQYGTPAHLSVTEQAGVATYKALHLSQRYPNRRFIAAPYAWEENGNTPKRWGVQFLRGKALGGPFMLCDWGYGAEPAEGAETAAHAETFNG